MSGLPVRVRLLLVLVILSNVTGNLFLTLGVRGGWERIGWLLLGVGLLILWTVSRMSLLSWADLSYVLPVTSIGYVLSAVCGKYFFDEQISPTRWAGTLLIVAGTAVVSRTGANST
jgi:drug/metabolite transporter (DMT)-like permease